MKRPSFQFYPNDWTGNPNLKRCTFAEKGIWLEVMCLMHDQDEYGVLRWPLKEIAEAVKCRVADLQALIRKGVLKGHDAKLDDPFIYVPRSGRKNGAPVTLVPIQSGPLWFSSRMVKDEYIRTIRGESSRFGVGNGDTPMDSPKPPFGDGSSTSSSSSPSVNNSVEPTSTSTRIQAQGEDSPPSRFLEITKLLCHLETERGKEIKVFSSDGYVKGWVAAGVTDAQIREAHGFAVAEREREGASNPIMPAYLDAFIARIMNPQGGSTVAAVKVEPPKVCVCCGAPWTKRLGNEHYCSEHDQFSARKAA